MRKNSLALCPTVLLFLAVCIPWLAGEVNSALWSPAMLISTIFLARWAYLVARELTRRAIPEARLDLAIFTRRLIYGSVAMGILMVDTKWISNPPGTPQWSDLLGIIVLFPLYYWIFSGLNFLSKAIAQVETQKPAKFDQYAGYFACFFFFPFGMWWINPRIKDILRREAVTSTRVP